MAAESGVVFLDMHGPGAYEKQTGETLCNPAEADLVMQLVDALLAGGVPLSAIGGMSPYRSQVMWHSNVVSNSQLIMFWCEREHSMTRYHTRSACNRPSELSCGRSEPDWW